MRELKFSPGVPVEVNIDPHNSSDIWFPATFIEQVSKNSFLVAYRNSKEVELPLAAVDSLHIRPSPPCSSTKVFNLLEKVDAFCDYHWLSGVVTKILKNGRYIIYFKHTKKEKELCHTDLRLHMEWTNGKWVNPSQDNSMSPSSEKKSDHAVNSGFKEKICFPTGIVKTNVGEETLSSLLQTSGGDNANNNGSTLSNKRSKRASVHGDSTKPSNQLNKRAASNVVIPREASKTKMKELVGSNNGTQTDHGTSKPSTPGRSSLKHSEDSDQPSASMKNKGDEQRKQSQVTIHKRKRGRPCKVLFRVGSPNVKEAELVDGSKDTVSNAKGHSPTDEAKSIAEVEIVRTRKAAVEAPHTGSRKQRANIISDQVEHLSEICKLTTSTSKKTLQKLQKISNELVKEEDLNDSVSLTQIRRGKRQRYCKQSVPPAADDSRDRVAEVCNRGVDKDVETVVAGTSSNVSDDDRPLSALLRGYSPTRVLVAETARRCDETAEKFGQNVKQAVDQTEEKVKEIKVEKIPAVNTNQDNNVPDREDEIALQSTAIVPTNNEGLPFLKSSFIWKMIESMEVFKRIPQNPHFRPLYNCKEECREGLAIGNMVTFSSLVERVSRLQFGDPKSILVGYLEGLVDLEELGFNMAPVRDLLDTLLAIKGRHEQTQNAYKEMENQITGLNLEKSKINEEIVELDKMIAELNEKRTLVMSKKVMRDAEIASLQSSLDAIKGPLESAEEEFKKVTASFW